MRFHLWLAIATCLLIPLGGGCSKSVPPPVAIPVDQLPAALEKAFAKAKPEPKELANKIIADVKAQDYTKAWSNAQQLSGQPGLNKEQRKVAAGGLLTLNNLMQEEQAKGNAKAAQALKFHRENK